MSYREKSAWATLLVMLVVYAPYFINVAGMFRRGQMTGGALLGAFMGAVGFQVGLSIAVAIALAILTREEPPDERDRAIEAQAYRYAYNTLVAGPFVLIPAMFGLMSGIDPAALPGMLTISFLSQALLLCLVAAETVRYVTQIIGYRKGSL
jgi:hypothetical protein